MVFGTRCYTDAGALTHTLTNQPLRAPDIEMQLAWLFLVVVRVVVMVVARGVSLRLPTERLVYTTLCELPVSVGTLSNLKSDCEYCVQ